MRISRILQSLKQEGEVISRFGQATLIKTRDFKYELRGGSSEDQTAAKEWISMFMHEVVVTICAMLVFGFFFGSE